jgi:uncharacterized membrane protein (DUF2068 family)
MFLTSRGAAPDRVPLGNHSVVNASLFHCQAVVRSKPHMKSSENGVIRLVAVFKLLKAAFLVVAGIGILKLIHMDVARELDHGIAMLGLDPGSRYVNHLIQKATNLSPNKIKELGLGSFVYAALFLTEGIGLWLLKRWAEWFTVVITSSLVPLEAYEIYRHPAPIKIIVLVINIAIVGYLLHRIAKEPRDRQGRGDGR